MRRATTSSDAWKYFEQLNPDVALLQEVVEIPEFVHKAYSIKLGKAAKKNGESQKFGSALVVKGKYVTDLPLDAPYEWVREQLSKYSGNLVGGVFNVGEHDRLHILSMYLPAWPILDSSDLRGFSRKEVAEIRLDGYEDIFLSEIVWSALRQRLPRHNERWIIGGDLNCSFTFEKKWRTTGSRQVLDRFKKLGLVECLSNFKGGLVPTFRHSRGMIEDQIDHLYVTPSLLNRLNSCNVGDANVVFNNSLSDHLPIVAEFE